MKNRIEIVLAIALLIAMNASADFMKKEEPVRVKFYPAETAKPGEVAEARLEVEIRKGWHIFSNTPELKGITPSEIAVDASDNFTVEPIKYPPPEPEYSDVFKKDLNFYTGLLIIPVHLKLKPGVAGEIPVNGTFRYQACSDKLCMPPSKLVITAVQPIR